MSDQLPAKREKTPEGLLATWMPEQLLEDFEWQTTLPQETRQQRYQILSLIEGECMRGSDLIGSEMFLWHYIAHKVTLTDEETGEQTDAIRIVLVQPDAPPVAFVSLGVLQSIARIQKAEQRSMPFDPPVKVFLRQMKGKGARRVYKLIPVVE